jgi:hypothetical protein
MAKGSGRERMQALSGNWCGDPEVRCISQKQGLRLLSARKAGPSAPLKYASLKDDSLFLI